MVNKAEVVKKIIKYAGYKNEPSSALVDFLIGIADGSAYDEDTLETELEKFGSELAIVKHSSLDIAFRVAVAFDQVESMKTLVDIGANYRALHWVDQVKTQVTSSKWESDDEDTYYVPDYGNSSRKKKGHTVNTTEEIFIARSVLEYCFRNKELGLDKPAINTATYLIKTLQVSTLTNIRTLPEYSDNQCVYKLFADSTVDNETVAKQLFSELSHVERGMDKMIQHNRLLFLIQQAESRGFLQKNSTSNFAAQLLCTVIRIKDLAGFDILLSKLANKEQPNFCISYLMALPSFGETDMTFFDAMVKAKVNPNSKPDENDSPLEAALRRNNLPACKALIKIGADYKKGNFMRTINEDKDKYHEIIWAIQRVERQSSSATQSTSTSSNNNAFFESSPADIPTPPSDYQLVVLANSVIVVHADPTKEGIVVPFDETSMAEVLGEGWMRSVAEKEISIADVLLALGQQLKRSELTGSERDDGMSLFK